MKGFSLETIFQQYFTCCDESKFQEIGYYHGNRTVHVFKDRETTDELLLRADFTKYL